MTAMRNKRLAWALEQTGLLQWWARKEAERRHAIAEAARAAICGPPMTAAERRQHGEAVAAVRRADEAKRQAG